MLAYNYINENHKKEPDWFAVKNPFIIDNVNQLLEIEFDGNFQCIADENSIKDRDSKIPFKCTRCGEIIYQSIHNIRKKNDKGRNGISCPNCDGHYESIHALVLKQIFLKEFPDTILEDPSCYNPYTNKCMPTDIVNHRLKIAVEIQGQYHNRENQKVRDQIKKEYWINRGYEFYDYSIDKVSILEYVQYFFPDIIEIPNYVNMDFCKKLDLKKIQHLLNNGYKVKEISEKLNVSSHRIYDAILYNKLYYPESYNKCGSRPIVMLDKELNVLKEYKSYSEAEKENNITKGLIASSVFTRSFYSSGFYWIPKDLYDDKEIKQILHII